MFGKEKEEWKNDKKKAVESFKVMVICFCLVGLIVLAIFGVIALNDLLFDANSTIFSMTILSVSLFFIFWYLAYKGVFDEKTPKTVHNTNARKNE